MNDSRLCALRGGSEEGREVSCKVDYCSATAHFLEGGGAVVTAESCVVNKVLSCSAIACNPETDQTMCDDEVGILFDCPIRKIIQQAPPQA